MSEKFEDTEETLTIYIKDIINGINKSTDDIDQQKNQISRINTALEKIKKVYINSIKKYNNEFTDTILKTYSISKLKDMYDNTKMHNIYNNLPYKTTIKGHIYFDIFFIALFNKKNYLFNKVFLNYGLLNKDNTQYGTFKELYELLYIVYNCITDKKDEIFIQSLNNLYDNLYANENDDDDKNIYDRILLFNTYIFTREIPIINYKINKDNCINYSNIIDNINNINNIPIKYPFLYINITNFDINNKLVSYFERVTDRTSFDVEFPFILNIDKHHLYLNSIILLVKAPIYYICIYEVNRLWHAFYCEKDKYITITIGNYDTIFNWNGPDDYFPHGLNFVKKHVIGLFYV